MLLVLLYRANLSHHRFLVSEDSIQRWMLRDNIVSFLLLNTTFINEVLKTFRIGTAFEGHIH